MNRTNSFVELGCGTGFISFGLSKFFCIPGKGIDIQDSLEPFFYRGKAENDIQTELLFKSFDICHIRDHLAPESTELCVFNPPHYIEGRGKETTDAIRGLTRASREDVCEIYSEAAAYILKTRGYFSCVITPQNFENWVIAFRKNNLSMKSIIPVYGKRDSHARLLLIKGLKNGGTGFLEVASPVFLY
ncbi:MAG TPA: hypothetical protein PLO84_04650 [Thermotogota bacterium]|nr:hypothetical protein [Thermotogota bacterium]HPJ88391.1 hypothetical protein [Thermotogota bacterium]